MTSSDARATSPDDWRTGVAWVWRLVLALAAGWATWLMLSGRSTAVVLDQLRYFTIESTIAVLLVNAGAVLRPLVVRSGPYRFEGRRSWFRGLATSMTVFTGIIFATLLGHSYPDTAGRIAHAALPAAMLLDWLLVGRSHRRPAWWVPLTWAAVLVPYLFLYAWDARTFGAPMYPFLDPASPHWWGVVAAAAVAFLALTYLLRWLARATGRRRG